MKTSDKVGLTLALALIAALLVYLLWPRRKSSTTGSSTGGGVSTGSDLDADTPGEPETSDSPPVAQSPDPVPEDARDPADEEDSSLVDRIKEQANGVLGDFFGVTLFSADDAYPYEIE